MAGEMDEGQMKRVVALIGLMVLPVLGFTPGAHAIGYGACTISGTIVFSAGAGGPAEWKIPAAVLDCQGLIAARRRIIGPGPFRGSGTFTTLDAGGCLVGDGTGKINYEIPTSGGDILVSEPVNLTVAGGGAINTPTLHGLFQLPPPYGGDCVTTAEGRATFVAEVVLYRYPREIPPHLPGPDV